MKVINKYKSSLTPKIIEITALLIIVSGIIFVNSQTDIFDTFGKGITGVWSASGLADNVSARFAGIIGGLVGGAFFALTRSKFASDVILILFAIIDIMFIFRLTLYKLLSKAYDTADSVGKKASENRMRRRYEDEEADTDRPERQKHGTRKKSDPTQVVDDFFAHTGSAEAEQTEDKAPVAAADKSAEDIPEISLFDGDKAPAANDFDDIFDIPDDDVAVSPDDIFGDVTAEEKADENVKPLTDEEVKELDDSLNDGLGSVLPVEYIKPPLACLNPPKAVSKNYTESELKANGEKLINALKSFNVSATIVDVVPGPTVTRYELSPAPGVKISKFVVLADDLALHMAAPAGLRIEAPIPNKAAIGIEIPNRNKITVTFREVIDTEKFRNAKSKLNVALGKDITGDPVYSDLAKMPHLLVAGTTGSGKSVCLNTMIASLLYNASPEEVKLLLIDPKQVEFGVYNGLPHLLVPVVSDPRKAAGALGWAVTEMLSRYKTLNACGVRDIGAYNNLCEERDDLAKMPQIVIVIDELADLMTVAPGEVEDSIQRLAQMARAAGMHLVIATQRPSVDVITGVIKSNIPSRIALTVKSQFDSRTIIDSGGAEKLMGNGDMLYYPVGISKPVRVQGAYLADSEIENIVDFIKANGRAEYDDAVQQEIDRQAVADKKKSSSSASEQSGLDANDALLMSAIELFVNTPEKASISALQRHLSLGFAKAGRLMDTLEEKGIVGPSEGSKPRKVLITKAQWYEMNASNSSSAGNTQSAAEQQDSTGAADDTDNLLTE